MSRDTNFYYSFLVLPQDKRNAIIAVWDFCRAVDDAVDGPDGTAKEAVPSPEAAARELRRWRQELEACFSGAAPTTPQGRRLQPFIPMFELPRASFEDLIDGVEMDVGQRRYATFDELHQYCLRVASAVGLICLEIFGYQNPRAREYGQHLGVALQLTNIVRDVGVDAAHGRLYLPLEDLRRFGVTEADVAAGRLDAGMRGLLRFQCDRARSFYDKAHAALPPEDARTLVAAEIMGAIYFAILERIERADYDVFSSLIRVPRPRRAVIAAVTWARTMLAVTQPRFLPVRK
jgi:phytoene synthase